MIRYLAALLLILIATAAEAQGPPVTMPPNTVYGRLNPNGLPGPGEAIPISSLATGGAAVGGVLTGSLPNPGMAAGAAANNIGPLGGVLIGTLPNPGLRSGAAANNIGPLGGALAGILPNPSFNLGALFSLYVPGNNITITCASTCRWDVTGPASATTLAVGQPVIGNDGSAMTTGTKSGNTTTFATVTGTLINGHCVSTDSSGNLIDAGAACGSGGGGGSGTVTAGTTGQVPFYPANGTTVNGGAFGTTANTFGWITSGTNVVPTCSGTGCQLNVTGPPSATSLAAGQPVFGNGPSAMTTGTLSGNTTQLVTTTGSRTPNDCVKIDGFGNFVDAGAACSSGGGGSGTVGTGTANQIAWYSAGGTSVIGGAFGTTANTAGWFTTGTNTLPVCSGASCIINVTGPPSATTLTAGKPVIGNGTSAVSSGTTSGNTTEFATATGTLTSGHCVAIDGSGNFIDAGGACSTGGGGGTVTAGTIGQVAYYAAAGTAVTGGTFGTIANTYTYFTAGINTSVTCATSCKYDLVGPPSATTLTAGKPVFGAGTSAMVSGSTSGNTTTVATTNGTLISGHCVSIDASGNLVDSGAVCGGGSGGTGTVNPGLAGQLATYATGGNAISGENFATLTQGGLGASMSSATANAIPVFPGGGGGAAPMAGSTWFDAWCGSAVGQFLVRTATSVASWSCRNAGYIDPRWYGAVGDGSTDDTAAFNAAINQIKNNGGTIRISNSPTPYCINRVVVPAGVRIVSASKNTAISACNTDTTPIILNGPYASMWSTTVFGYIGTTSAVPVSPAIVMGPACIDCVLWDIRYLWGTGLAWECGECHGFMVSGTQSYNNIIHIGALGILDVAVTTPGSGGVPGTACTFTIGSGITIAPTVSTTVSGSGGLSGGTQTGNMTVVFPGYFLTAPPSTVSNPVSGCGVSGAQVSVTFSGVGGFLNRFKMDSNLPFGTYKGAYTTLTGYNAGDVVSNAGSQHLVLYAKRGGTPAGSIPTNIPYGVDFVDGSVIWNLVSVNAGANVVADTGTSEAYFWGLDATANFMYNVRMLNTLGGTGPVGTPSGPPRFIRCEICDMSQSWNVAVDLEWGNGFYITDVNVAGFTGIYTSNHWTSTMVMIGGTLTAFQTGAGGTPMGALLAAGTDADIIGVNPITVQGGSTGAIGINIIGTDHCLIEANTFTSTGTATGIQMVPASGGFAGTNHCLIVGNDLIRAGTGINYANPPTNNFIQSNSGNNLATLATSRTWPLGSGVVYQAGASAEVHYFESVSGGNVGIQLNGVTVGVSQVGTWVAIYVPPHAQLAAVYGGGTSPPLDAYSVLP